jgi:uncharacterized membrane protein
VASSTIAEARALDIAADPASTISEGASSAGRTAFVCAFAGAYAVLFAAAAATNYLLYFEPRLDLGNMVQVVWSTSHGYFLHTSDTNGAGMSRLGVHADPFLAFLVPLWLAWSNPLVLLVAQAIAIAAGALPVYWLARKHVGDPTLSVVFVVAYLLYPATQFNAYTPTGIHAVSFAIPLILFAIWFLDEGRLPLFVLFAALAATTKEEIGAAIGGLGLWYAVRRGRRTGLAIAAVGIGITLLNLLVVIPHYASNGVSPFADRYSNVGGTPGGVIRTAVTDPGAFVHEVATWHKALFVVLVFAPFLGLWALEPLLLIGAAPDLAINLLSSKPEQTTVFHQYTAGVVPFVVAASIFGAARLQHARRTRMALLGVMGCFAIVSPLVWTAMSVHSRSWDTVTATRSAVRLVPSDAPVSVSQSLGGYVSARKVVALFPAVARADWVLVGPAASGVDNPGVFRRAIARLRASPSWTTVFDAQGVSVFERSNRALPRSR